MTEEKKQSEEITQAGAVELEENALDEAAGGVLSVGDIKSAPATRRRNSRRNINILATSTSSSEGERIMTEDKKQSEEITPAGAVELEETALDETSGGGLSADTIAWKLDRPETNMIPSETNMTRLASSSIRSA